jgi:hypothetical protein
VQGYSHRPPPHVRWHHRLDARVAAGLTLLIGLSLGAVLIATIRVVSARSLTRAAAELDVARLAFSRSLDARSQSASALTRLVTALPVFRALISDARVVNDPQTMYEMSDGYRRQLNARFSVVTNARGAWLASPGWSAGGNAPALMSSIESARHGKSNRAILSVDNHLFLVVSEPGRFGDEILGTLTMGYSLDDAVAAELAQVTDCQISLVSSSQLSGSSLPASERAALIEMLSNKVSAPPRLSEIRLAGERYIYGSFPLAPDQDADSQHRLVLLKPWRPTQQFLDASSAASFSAGT